MQSIVPVRLLTYVPVHNFVEVVLVHAIYCTMPQNVSEIPVLVHSPGYLIKHTQHITDDTGTKKSTISDIWQKKR